MKFNFLILNLISLALLACGLNKPGSNDHTLSYTVDPVTPQSNINIIKVDPVWKRPLIKEITLPICFKTQLNHQPILEQQFKVTLNTVVAIEKTRADDGCIYFIYPVELDSFNTNITQKFELKIEGQEQFKGVTTIDVLINPLDDQNIFLDLRFNSERSVSIGQSSQSQLLIKEAQVSYQEQVYQIKKSLELKVSRSYNIQFDPYLIESNRDKRWQEPKPLLFGQFSITALFLANDLNLNNFLTKLKSCDVSCVVSHGEGQFIIENQGHIDGALSLTGFFHDFSSISDKNIVLFLVHSDERSIGDNVFIGQLDLLSLSAQDVKLTRLSISPEEVQHIAELQIKKKSQIESDLPIAESSKVFEGVVLAQKDDYLSEFADFQLSDLSLSRKTKLCAHFLSGLDIASCIYNFKGSIKLKKVARVVATQTENAMPVLEDQFIIRTSLEVFHEYRVDKGENHGWKLEEGLFEQGTVNVSGGLKVLGNGVSLEGSAGFKAEQTRYDMYYTSYIDSDRTRAQMGTYKEFVVDQLKFNIPAQSQSCLHAELLKTKKRFYFCSSSLENTSLNESYYYLRPRQVNMNQVGIIDSNKSSINFRKTIFGELNYAKFKEAIENKLVTFVERKILDIELSKISGESDRTIQLPVLLTKDESK